MSISPVEQDKTDIKKVSSRLFLFFIKTISSKIVLYQIQFSGIIFDETVSS